MSDAPIQRKWDQKRWVEEWLLADQKLVQHKPSAPSSTKSAPPFESTESSDPTLSHHSTLEQTIKDIGITDTSTNVSASDASKEIQRINQSLELEHCEPEDEKSVIAGAVTVIGSIFGGPTVSMALSHLGVSTSVSDWVARLLIFGALIAGIVILNPVRGAKD